MIIIFIEYSMLITEYHLEHLFCLSSKEFNIKTSKVET